MKEAIDKRKIQLMELDMLMEMDRICKKNNLKYYLAYGTVLGAIRHKGFIPWDDDIDIIVNIDNYKKFCDIIHNEITDNYVLCSIDQDPNYDSLKARISLKNNYHHIIYIDIFPIIGVPKSRVGRKLFSKICYIIYKSYFVKKVDVNITYKESKRKRTNALIAKLLLKPVSANLIKLIFDKLSTLYSIKESSIIFNICGCYGYKELIPKEYLGEPVWVEFEGLTLPIPEKWDAYLTHLYGEYMIPKQKNHV